MRTMKESTYDAIKSRNMIGENKFNYDLKVEGIVEGYSDIQSSVLKSNVNVDWFDYVILGNTQILIAYRKGVNIYLLKLASVNELLANDNIIQGGELFITLAENQCAESFSLQRLKNDEVLLCIADGGNLALGIPAWTKVFVSSNGQGTEFTLCSTIASWTRLGADSNYDLNFVTKPVQLDDGSLFISASKYASYGGYDQSLYAIYKSTDNGRTWTLKWNTSDRRHTFLSTMLCDLINVGDVLFSTIRNSNLIGSVMFFSADKGETWSVVTSAFSNFVSLGDTHKYVSVVYNKLENRLFLVMVGTVLTQSFNMYKSIELPEIITPTWINTFSNWGKIVDEKNAANYAIRLSALPDGTITWAYYGGYIYGFNRTYLSSPFKASSITINKGRGGANTATIKVNNKDGIINPRNPNSELYGILKLNRGITIKQGYGDDIVESFTGIIDSIKMSTFPQVADIALRDNLKRALDQMITKNGVNTIAYTKQPIENIVADLCTCAGLDVGYIEPTGISIEKTFSWQSYADAFQFLSDLASFEFLTDEVGKFHFRRDYQPNNMYVAWSFEEGIDITSLNYEINDNDLYYSVKVYGKSGDTILVYEAPFLDAPEFNILPQKVLKIDATEASTVTELRKIAERAISTMRSRTRVIDFSTVGIPHLQIGDFIQLFESSTASADVYRLTSMALNMTDRGFTMTCKAYYYGDSVSPIELPTENADQPIGNPTLNLIPEMTSNTTPSGVARASSVYVLYSNDYKPWNAFNSTNADLFWDASINHGWIEYEFPENTIVDKYMLKARQDTTYNLAMPKAWTFEAFDGEKWIVLDTRTAQTAWAVHEQREFTFANVVAYPKYRLNVSANCGYKRLQLEQLGMYYRGGL